MISPAPPQLRNLAPSTRRRKGTGSRRLPRLSRKPSVRAVTGATRNLAVMVSARLPLLEALTATAKQTSDERLRTVLADVKKDVAGGRSLADSLAKQRAFTPLAIQLVRVGESTGLLGEVLIRLSEHQEMTDALRRQIRQALAYPAFVLGVALVATVFLLAFVVPIFAGLYIDFDADLPGPTQIVLSISEAMVAYAPFIFGGLMLSGLVFRKALKTPGGQRARDRMVLHIPIVGTMLRNALIARFSRTLSTLLDNGVTLADGLELLGRSSENMILSEQVDQLLRAIKRGEALAASLPRQTLFPPVLVHLAAVGEATGRLGHVLTQAAAYYEDEVEAATQNLGTLLEPILIVLIGIILGGILVAMYLPLFDLVTVVGM